MVTVEKIGAMATICLLLLEKKKQYAHQYIHIRQRNSPEIMHVFPILMYFHIKTGDEIYNVLGIRYLIKFMNSTCCMAVCLMAYTRVSLGGILPAPQSFLLKSRKAKVITSSTLKTI